MVSILVLRAVFPLEEVVLLLLGQLVVQLEQQTVGNEVICVGHIDHVRSVVVEQSGVNRRVIVAPRQNFHIHFAVVLRLKSIEPAIPEIRIGNSVFRLAELILGNPDRQRFLLVGDREAANGEQHQSRQSQSQDLFHEYSTFLILGMFHARLTFLPPLSFLHLYSGYLALLYIQ